MFLFGPKGIKMVSKRALTFSPQKYWYRIEPQCWSNHFSPLDRSVIGEVADNGETKRDFLFEAMEDSTSRFLLFSNGKILVDTLAGQESVETSGSSSIAWRSYRSISKLGLKFHELEDGYRPEYSTMVLLGKTKDHSSDADIRVHMGDYGTGWHFAIDASRIPDKTLISELSSDEDEQVITELKSPRDLLGMLEMADISVVGQSVSKLNWHSEVQYCRRSGRPVFPAGAGHRKIDPIEENTRLNVSYPRTDPVAIMLVTSSDGSKCLLGRTRRRHKSNMYSCLAGFIEQAESVEDAVRRETFEESGIIVGDDITIVGTQPWPIGAAGHSELMLGCIARAESDTIDFDEKEMSDVRWFSKKEVRDMLDLSRKQNPIGNSSEKPLVVPPPYAIAHHLIKTWAEDRNSENNIGSFARLFSSAAVGAVVGAMITLLLQSRL